MQLAKPLEGAYWQNSEREYILPNADFLGFISKITIISIIMMFTLPQLPISAVEK